ncbi:hypothetical protein OSB04_011572 [Centaurea solstitialis]|uniref:Integrase catalytic domain-containing protein n=1 Tax=Centaurea solstitialis TaxID=347529 RepID=A0AA38TUF5_9ASTR|nr:hypothetical protein OSB04_011572 [Centaurea solstitialis]
MKHKHEAFKKFKLFQSEVENQLNKTIKVLRSDRGGEYLSEEFQYHLRNCGIVSQLTPPRTPQNNGVSERRNRTLLDDSKHSSTVHHRFSTAYHPQANGQAENTNRALEKTVDNNPKIWSQKLEDALWAYRTAYKTPIGSNPYRMFYGKACHLPFEFEYKALWALKKVHLDDIASGNERLINLHELEELRSLAYENSKIYKEQRKKWHDAHLKEVKVFKEGDKVLMYQTLFKFSPGKLKLRWIGPYVVLKAYPSGYVDLMTERGEFKVNGHRIKLYNEDDPVRNGVVYHLSEEPTT